MERGNASAESCGPRPVADRRSEPRSPANPEVSLKIPGWAGLPNPMRARIVNVSGHGMRLHTAHPVECGAHVEIETLDGLIAGEVSRCQLESKGYSLGVRIVRSVK